MISLSRYETFNLHFLKIKLKLKHRFGFELQSDLDNYLSYIEPLLFFFSFVCLFLTKFNKNK